MVVYGSVVVVLRRPGGGGAVLERAVLGGPMAMRASLLVER